MNEVSPSTSLPLQTVEDGKAPARRVKNADDAAQICRSLIEANRERARFFAKVKGMLDGVTPFDPAKLKAQAQAYRTNINFREGKASLSAALVPYYDLFAGAQFYCEVKLDLDDPDEAQKKSDVVTEEFDTLLDDYTGFEFNMNSTLFDFIAFGRGFVIWPNEWGWHFQRASFSRVFVPDATDASVENLEVLVVREKMQVHKLWGFIKDRESARSLGWNTTAAALAIEEAVPEDRTTNINNTLSYEYIQQRMKDRDLVEGLAKQPTVQVEHLFVREFDGTITHMIVLEDTSGTSHGKSALEFIFEKQKKFENFRQLIAGFFLETLDGSWNGSTGLGHELYAPIEIKNRLLCKITDNAFLSGGITLQANDANSKQKSNLVQAGDFNIIPPGFTVQNASIFTNNNGLLAAGQLLDQVLASNTGIFKSKVEAPKGNPRTAAEVELQMQNATTLSNSGVSRFYGQLDPFYAEIYRRVVEFKLMDSDKSEEAEGVRKFIERCKRRGVTHAELKKVRSVRAYRNIGNGSQMHRKQMLEQFGPFLTMLPEDGREQWLLDLCAAQFGATAAARYIPDRRMDTPDDQQAMAMMENAIMKQGAPVAWTPTQNNLKHGIEHMKAMSAAASSLQQGGNPAAVLGFLDIAAPHALVHLEKLKADTSHATEYKQLMQGFNQIAGLADQLHAQLQEQQLQAQEQQQEQMMAAQQAAAIQDGTDPDTKIAVAKAQKDMQLKEMKASHKMRLDEAKLQHRIAVDTTKTKQGLAMNDVKLAQEIHARQTADVE